MAVSRGTRALGFPVAVAHAIDESGRVTRLYERVASDVRAALASGRYAIGDRLPSERDLAQQYKVSRPTIREAIIALEVDGLVDVRTNSGVYVAALVPAGGAPSETHVGGFELLEARRLIESQIAALAASQIDAARIGRLRALVAAMECHDLTRAETADREFHLEIARATGNSALEMTAAMLWDTRHLSPQYRLLSQKVRAAGIAPRQSEHLRILDALESGDPTKAHEAMWDHLTRVIESLLETTGVEAIENVRDDGTFTRRRLTGERRALPAKGTR